MAGVDFFSLPMDARPGRDPIIGYDEAGNPLYRGLLGNSYTVKPQASPQAMRDKAIAERTGLIGAFDPSYTQEQAAREVDLPGGVGGLFSGLLQGVMQGVEAPGRAARGEPVTYGDVWSTALDYGALAAPAGKPAGAIGGGGIRAYHGSPHDFDRFDLSKIGTGEGAQAYGHGLYFAQNEAVARGYRDDLTAGLRLAGKPIDTVWVDEIRSRWPEMYRGLSTAQAEQMDSLLGTMSGMESMRDMENAARSVGAERLFAQRVKPALAEAPPGRMYEVNINADPADFLDWDAPLSQQSPKVRGGVENALGFETDDIRSGMSMYTDVGLVHGRTGPAREMPRLAAEKLREAGIPGIKYLDAGSRGAGDGSRNFVVFDDRLIEIVRKYGIAGAAAMLGMSAAELQAQMGGASAAPSADDLRGYLLNVGAN